MSGGRPVSRDNCRTRPDKTRWLRHSLRFEDVAAAPVAMCTIVFTFLSSTTKPVAAGPDSCFHGRVLCAHPV